LKCPATCDASQWPVEIRGRDDRLLYATQLGREIWPQSRNLHYRAIELTAPAESGCHAWTVVAPAVRAEPDGKAAPDAVTHAAARTEFNLRVVTEPEHRLQITAVERSSRQPVAGIGVVAHPYRTTTDAGGVAELRLPQGPYRLFVSGPGYLPLRLDGLLSGDSRLRAELEPDQGPTDAELWS
jgi:hypothetical protein